MQLSGGNTTVLGGNCPRGNCPRWELSGGHLSAGQLSGRQLSGGGDCPRTLNCNVHEFAGEKNRIKEIIFLV